MPDPVDYVARLRAEREDPAREGVLRADRARRRIKWTVAGGAAALTLAGVTLWLTSATSGERPANEPYAAGALDEAMWPDEWPATTNLPFRGSPSATWATGSDGIELPEAKAVGGIPKERVADALSRSKELLVAANLDPAVLRGGSPVRALALLDPKGPGRGELVRHLREPGPRTGDPTELFTRFDPAELRVVADGVRVRGGMTFEAGERPGQVRIHVDVTFVYAVRSVVSGGVPGPAPGTEEATRTVVRRQLVIVVNESTRPGSPPAKLIPLEYRRHLSNHDCGSVDGFVRPSFSKDAADADPDWPVADPYDNSKKIKGGPDCSVPTRT